MKATGMNLRKWMILLLAGCMVLSLAACDSAGSQTETSEEETLDSEEIAQEAAEVIPYFSDRYLLGQLSDEELADFIALYEAVASFQDEVEYPCTITMDQSKKLAYLLVYECPELFQYDRDASYTCYYTDSEQDEIVSRELVYAFDKSTYETMYSEVTDVLYACIDELSGTSEAEQEQALYEYLIRVNTYDQSAENAENPYGTLVDNKSKCDGIALTFKWMLDILGIPNYILTGDPDGLGDGHAWNVVEIEGSFVDVDITNDDWDMDDEENEIYVYPYGLLNVSTSMIRDSYTIREIYDDFETPGTDDMSLSYHALNGTLIPSGDTGYDLFSELVLSAIDGGDEYFCFQFETDEDFEAFTENVQDYVNEIASGYEEIDFSVTQYNKSSSRTIWCMIETE